MEEALVLTSGKEAAGMGVINVRTGSAVCAAFKNCIAEAGALCAIGSSSSSYSGYGSSGDYIAVAQAKKPCINIWQWGKPQAHFQCHIQEIVISLVADPLGAFLFAGTQKGWIYCWELSTGELVSSFQAHFKAITRLCVTKVGAPFCISLSEDGTGRAWELHKILDVAESYKHVGRQSITPFRTWSAHTLPIKDCVLFDTLTTLRVLTCSLDRTLVLYDVLQAHVCLRVSLPHSLESVTCNPTQDLVCAGASNGSIFLVDLTSTAVAVTAAHAHVSHHLAADRSKAQGGLPVGTSVLEGHSKAVTSVNFSRDNSSLVSASADGTVRVWNVWTRQCLREYTPLSKHGITNAMMIPVPETLSIGVTRPTFCPVSHLNKYFKDQQTQNAGAAGQGGAANGTAPSTSGSVGGVASGLPSIVLGPSFLSKHEVPAQRAAKRRYTQEATEGVTKPSAKRVSQSVEDSDMMFAAEEAPAQVQDQEEEEEDYMALSGSFVAPKKGKMGSRKRRSLEAPVETQAAVGEEDVSAQLQEALAQVAALQRQNEELQERQREVVLLQAMAAAVTAAAAETASAPAVEAEAMVLVEDEPIKELSARDRSNRRKSVMPAKGRAAPVEEEQEEAAPAEETAAPVVAVVTSKDRANRRKSVLPAKIAPLPVIEEDAPLQMAPADAVEVTESAASAVKGAKVAARDRANRRKSVMVKDLPVGSPDASAAGAAADFASPQATLTAAALGADLRTPVAPEDDSELESIMSVGGTRIRVKKAVQFSGQDHVKLITPHKLPGFCESFQSGIGSAAKVASLASAEKKAAKSGGRGRK